MTAIISTVATIIAGSILLAAAVIAVSVAVYLLEDYVDRIIPGDPEDWWLG